MDNVTKVYILESVCETGIGVYTQLMGVFSTKEKAHEIRIRYPKKKYTITEVVVDEYDPTH